MEQSRGDANATAVIWAVVIGFVLLAGWLSGFPWN
jgi:septal ring factor EnvC (AmiA/AmiB activator)